MKSRSRLKDDPNGDYKGDKSDCKGNECNKKDKDNKNEKEKHK